ncbi:MAG: hypothetical protein R2710_00700 [Acidimicrobiales bacterium]
MGVHVIAVYRPKPGGQEALEAEVLDHVPLLRRIGLATDTPSLVLRAPDGTIIEHFEWASHDAIEAAHSHPEVLEMWGRYDACCEYGTLADLPNATTMFAEFEYVGRY